MLKFDMNWHGTSLSVILCHPFPLVDRSWRIILCHPLSSFSSVGQKLEDLAWRIILGHPLSSCAILCHPFTISWAEVEHLAWCTILCHSLHPVSSFPSLKKELKGLRACHHVAFSFFQKDTMHH
jgi:hypothetical protein